MPAPAPPDPALMSAVADVVVAEEKARAAADRELAAEMARLRERVGEVNTVVSPELAKQIASAVRLLHESEEQRAAPKPSPPARILRIERDDNGNMVPVYDR